MFQQSILDSLSSIFGPMSWNQLAYDPSQPSQGLSPQNIASSFAEHYG